MKRHRYPHLLLILAITALLVLAACAGTTEQVSPATTSPDRPSLGRSQPENDDQTQEPTEPEMTPGKESTIPETVPDEETDVTAAVPTEEITTEMVETPTRLPPNAIPVHMFGRSVTYNWFSYWAWEGDDMAPVVKGRYLLYHHSIDGPETMFNSVHDIIETLPSDSRTVIWWKFCFDDFSGAVEAQSSIQRNEQIVQQMYRYVVEQKKYRLIIGNALPKVVEAVDPELVQAQRQYNQWLSDFQKGHAGKVYVLDLYSVLADANGAERANLASAPDDSHPNAVGYKALDAMFFPFLDRYFK